MGTGEEGKENQTFSIYHFSFLIFHLKTSRVTKCDWSYGSSIS